MRKIVSGLFITLDGVTDGPERWQTEFMDGELGAELGKGLLAADTPLLGRRTYEEWAAFWPSAGEGVPFAGEINALPKLVASTSLTDPTWANTTVIEGDIDSHLDRLKDGDGGDILINGSATLVRSLITAGLLDELQLLIHPVAVGGQSFFAGLDGSRFEVRDARSLSSGVVAATYVPVVPPTLA
jgi:dihydrofolate reductase